MPSGPPPGVPVWTMRLRLHRYGARYRHGLHQHEWFEPAPDAAADQEVDAVFASVFGFESFTSSAVAEAELVNTGLGGILPFAVLGSATSGSQLCMRSSSGGLPPTLRRLDIRHFGAPTCRYGGC